MVFFTIFASMIRLNATSMAEIVLTGLASYSKLAHMDCRRRRHDLSSIVFSVIIDLALWELHHVTAGASGHVTWRCKYFVELRFLDLLSFVRTHIILHFLLRNRLSTLWTRHNRIIHEAFLSASFEAMIMYGMEAFRALNHDYTLMLFDTLVTKTTHLNCIMSFDLL